MVLISVLWLSANAVKGTSGPASFVDAEALFVDSTGDSFGGKRGYTHFSSTLISFMAVTFIWSQNGLQYMLG